MPRVPECDLVQCEGSQQRSKLSNLSARYLCYAADAQSKFAVVAHDAGQEGVVGREGSEDFELHVLALSQ
eukprot:3189852-Rhodomonas_salina.1